MVIYKAEGLSINPDFGGKNNFHKPSIVITSNRDDDGLGGRVFTFDLSGRPYRVEKIEQDGWNWLQRSMANDWLYYSRDEQSTPKGLNSDSDYKIQRIDPSRQFTEAFASLDRLVDLLKELGERAVPFETLKYYGEDSSTERINTILAKIAAKDRVRLIEDAKVFHDILGGEIPILPPDTIRVDYQVIPIIIADGCGKGCGFCAFGGKTLSVRSDENIRQQLNRLAVFYGNNLHNYNSLFLGTNNGLAAGSDKVCQTAEMAYRAFDIRNAFFESSYLFMFSTLEAFLGAPDSTFTALRELPFDQIFINVGYEAITKGNLRTLLKPQSEKSVIEGLRKANQVNRETHKVRITGNFVIGDILDSEHIDSILSILSSFNYRGILYVSPLIGHSGVEVTADFYRIAKGVPKETAVYLYTMSKL